MDMEIKSLNVSNVVVMENVTEQLFYVTKPKEDGKQCIIAKLVIKNLTVQPK